MMRVLNSQREIFPKSLVLHTNVLHTSVCICRPVRVNEGPLPPALVMNLFSLYVSVWRAGISQALHTPPD